MTDALDNARAALERISNRLTVGRFGKSWPRETDADLLAMKDSANALRALIAEHESLIDAPTEPVTDLEGEDDAPTGPTDDEIPYARYWEARFAAPDADDEREEPAPAVNDAWSCDHGCTAPSAVCIVDHKPAPAADERTWVTGFLLGCGVREQRVAEYAGKLLASDVWKNRHRGSVTEEMVEAAAYRLYTWECRRQGFEPVKLQHELGWSKAAWIRTAHAALEAAEAAR